MRETTYYNLKSRKTRKGWWDYYWPGDFFRVQIKGLSYRRVYGERPEYGSFRLANAASGVPLKRMPRIEVDLSAQVRNPPVEA